MLLADLDQSEAIKGEIAFVSISFSKFNQKIKTIFST